MDEEEFLKFVYSSDHGVISGNHSREACCRILKSWEEDKSKDFEKYGNMIKYRAATFYLIPSKDINWLSALRTVGDSKNNVHTTSFECNSKPLIFFKGRASHKRI
jgi:hypothetical protein